MPLMHYHETLCQTLSLKTCLLNISAINQDCPSGKFELIPMMAKTVLIFKIFTVQPQMMKNTNSYSAQSLTDFQITVANYHHQYGIISKFMSTSQ